MGLGGIYSELGREMIKSGEKFLVLFKATLNREEKLQLFFDQSGKALKVSGIPKVEKEIIRWIEGRTGQFTYTLL